MAPTTKQVKIPEDDDHHVLGIGQTLDDLSQGEEMVTS
jgi:hypothetical protein